MDDFHCNLLELTFRIESDKIDKDALMQELEMKNQEDVGVPLVFDSREAPNEQHSHINIRFRPQELVRVEIEYHNSAGNLNDVKPPFMEDCAQWLGRFIKSDTVDAHINATYRFGKDFSFRVPLPFPLVSPDRELTGALVTGLALEFPKDSQFQNAFVQARPKATTVSIHLNRKIGLKGFDLYRELESLASPAISLLKKREQ